MICLTVYLPIDPEPTWEWLRTQRHGNVDAHFDEVKKAWTFTPLFPEDEKSFPAFVVAFKEFNRLK